MRDATHAHAGRRHTNQHLSAHMNVDGPLLRYAVVLHSPTTSKIYIVLTMHQYNIAPPLVVWYSLHFIFIFIFILCLCTYTYTYTYDILVFILIFFIFDETHLASQVLQACLLEVRTRHGVGTRARSNFPAGIAVDQQTGTPLESGFSCGEVRLVGLPS